MDESPEERVLSPEEIAEKRKKRVYIEPGEASLKGWLIILGIALLLAGGGFAYFMIFHFQDTFYEKQVVEIDLTKRAGA